MIKHQLFFFIALLTFVSSCKKDKPEEVTIPIVPVKQGGGVYIINEGNFQFGNAKVSYYDITSNEIIEDVFQQANNLPLGDVCQSMKVWENKAFIVMNNSKKIWIVNSSSFIKQDEITGFTSPRYILPVSNSKAYVTDLYSNAISIVNLSSNTISGTIPLTGWTEELASAYGKVFVTNKLSDKIYVINTSTDLITDSITVGYASNSIREDKNGKLWVLCEGNQSNINASLHCINPLNYQVEKSFQFTNVTDSPWRLNINGSNDTLYFLNGGIYQLAITADALPSSPLIAKGSHVFYGVGINPNNGEVYAADAIDYVQKGRVYRYKSDGTETNSFLAGIIPSEFHFN
jgi:YVTN family beta-propeller protein